MDLKLPSTRGHADFLTQHQHQSHSHQVQLQQLPPHPFFDCSRGPQFSQHYQVPSQSIEQSGGSLSGGHVIKPHETYGVPAEFSSPAASLQVPQHANFEFNPSSSYGPPASGNPTDSHEFASSSRSNIVVQAEKQNVEAAGSESSASFVPGQDLTKHAALDGLDIISAQKSESLSVPVEGKFGSYQLQFQSANGDNGNAIDAPNHQQFISDGLLQSIITAIEQKPSQTVPQVTEDQEPDHSEVQIFLKSPDGQEVLNDPLPEASS
jgi:hypothetical protein